VNTMTDLRGKANIPPPQNNLQAAVRKAVEELRGQSDEQLAWLGAAPSGGLWKLPVLGDALEVRLPDGVVQTSGGDPVRLQWRILVLHYLGIRARLPAQPPALTFASLPDGRIYAGNYDGRVIRRLCATVGRDAASLAAAAARLGAAPAEGGTLALDFDVFPRLCLRLVWHAGDDEFPPSAAVLLPANIGSMLCAEDVVVLSEQLVSRLAGKPF
jgi:hypothetical protein